MYINKQKRIINVAVLSIFLIIGAFFIANSAEASFVCKKYKEHKRKFKSEKNKNIYFKIKWVKNHDRKTYDYYRAICEPFKFDPYQFKGNLNETCHNYYIYEEYGDYLKYKKQCHKHDDNDDDVIVEPEPEPELQ
jgi:hypothetical protein